LVLAAAGWGAVRLVGAAFLEVVAFLRVELAVLVDAVFRVAMQNSPV
jgi:hypothetical protein